MLDAALLLGVAEGVAGLCVAVLRAVEGMPVDVLLCRDGFMSERFAG